MVTIAWSRYSMRLRRNAASALSLFIYLVFGAINRSNDKGEVAGRSTSIVEPNRSYVVRQFARFVLIVIALHATGHVVAQTCTSSVNMWIDSINSPTEGERFNVTVKRDRSGPLVNAFTARVRLSYTSPISGFDLFDLSLPTVLETEFGIYATESYISVPSLDNFIVNDDVGVEARVIEGTGINNYCIPDSSTQPSARTGTIQDDDSYTHFIDLAPGASATITEGEDISLVVSRCVVETHSGGSFTKHCVDPSNPTPGAVAPGLNIVITYEQTGNFVSNRPGLLNLPLNTFEAALTLETDDDEVDEFDGSIVVKTKPLNPLEGQSVTITIRDNDVTPPQDVWVDSVSDAREGANIAYILKRSGNDVADSESLTVQFQAEPVNPNLGFQVVETATQSTTFLPNSDTVTGTLTASENHYVHGDVQVRLKLLAGDSSVYQLDADPSRPSSKTAEIADNDSYSLFVALPAGQAATVDEGDTIQLAFTRCVLLSDATKNCTDPSTITGAVAPRESHQIYLSSTGNYGFSAFPGFVIFGDSVQTITVNVTTVDDGTHEVNGSLTANTTDPPSSRADQQVTVSVEDNDAISLAFSMPASVDEGDDLDITVTRSDSEVYPAVSVPITLAYHTKMFASGSQPSVNSSVAFLVGESSKTLSIPTHDDEVNEGDGQVVARITAPANHSITAPRQRWTRIVDDDIPHVTLTVDKNEVVEGDTATWTLTRSDYASNELIVRPSYEWVHTYVGFNNGSSFDAQNVNVTRHIGFIEAGNLSQSFDDCSFGITQCGDGDIVGPLNGYMKRRILSFPDTPYSGIPAETDPTFLPRYTSTEDWVEVTVYNSAPGLRITTSDNQVDEGDSITYTITRFGGRPVARSVAMRVNVDVSQSGNYLSSNTGSQVVTFAEDALTVDFTVNTDDDSIYENAGSVTVTLLAGANTGLTVDTYEFRTDVNTDGSYDHTVTTTVNDDDTVPVLTAQSVSVLETGGTLDFLLTLDKVSELTATVDFETKSVGSFPASKDVDFTHREGTVTFEAGETRKTVFITIVDDVLHENDETVELSLTQPTNLSLAADSAEGTIRDDDDPPVLTIQNATASEADSTLDFDLTLNVASGADAVVDYVTMTTGSDTATMNVDFISKSGNVVFSKGSTSGNISITLKDDNQVENDETFTVALSSPLGMTLAANSAVGTIIDDDVTAPTVSMKAPTLAVAEAAGSATVCATMTPTSSATVTVDVASGGGNATAGTDYTALAANAQLRFSAGDTEQCVAVAVADDAIDEANETFTVTLSNPTGGNAELGSQTATTVTIEDDDTKGITVSDTELDVTEGSSATYTVVLASQPTGTVTVTIAGHAGTDVTLADDTLTFTPSNWNTTQTVTVRAAEDSDAVDDPVTLTHTGGGADYAGLAGPTLAVTVDDNDTDPPK